MDDDIHHSKYRIVMTKKKIAEAHPGPDCDMAFKLLDRLRMANRSYGRIASYAGAVGRILDISQGPIAGWTRADIEEIHSKIADSKYANSVKKDTLTTLKRLYHFAKHEEIPSGKAGKGYDPAVAWITPSSFVDRHHKIQPSDLLTEDELMMLIQAVRESGRNVKRNVAMIFTLLEGAYRPGELLNIRMGGIEVGEGFVKISTTGKTGPKTLTLVSSYDSLREWIAEHPRAGDPAAYLWFHPNIKGVVPYGTLLYVIKAARKRAGIEKRIWTYLFRHTALTEYSKTLGSVAKIYGNWSKASNMINIYEHLASSDQEDAVMRLHGMRSSKKKSAILFSRECRSCRRINSADKEACSGCGHPLEEGGPEGSDRPATTRRIARDVQDVQDREAAAPDVPRGDPAVMQVQQTVQEVRVDPAAPQGAAPPSRAPGQAAGRDDDIARLEAEVEKLRKANEVQQKMINDLLVRMST